MSLDINTILSLCSSFVAIGAFYGAIKIEINWIKKTLERHEKIFEDLHK